MLRDMQTVGMAALQLPRALWRRECGTTQYLAERNARYPVLLVHGYAATAGVWAPLRRALAASAALSSQTASAVTIASPHRGALLARIAPGRCARLMHPGPRPELLGFDAPGPVRWLAYYSDADRVVPPASARLDDPRYGAANVLIPGCGHLTICHDARLIRSLVPELIRAETFADVTTPAEAGRELAAA